MKQLYAIVLSLFAVSLIGQVQNVQVTDCDGITKNIYQVLGTGKVLLVSSDGITCSICQNSAAGKQNFAASNKAGIEVWSAMTSGFSGGLTDCQSVDNWISTYTWSDIFTFVDSSLYWYKQGTPRFYVYSPLDSTLAYEGFSESTAFQTARSLVQNVSLQEPERKEFSVNYAEGLLHVNNPQQGVLRIQVVNITGKDVRSSLISDKTAEVYVGDLPPGLYLIRAEAQNGRRAVRKVYFR